MKIHLKGERDRQALRRKLGLWKMVALYRLLFRKRFLWKRNDTIYRVRIR